jgi:hypothetical protein
MSNPFNFQNLHKLPSKNAALTDKIKLAPDNLILARSQENDQPALFAENYGGGTAILAESSDTGVAVSGFSVKGIGVLGRVLETDGLAGSFHGTVHVDGDIKVTGNIEVGSDVILMPGGADYAEALTTTDPLVEAGLVVVLGQDGEVHPCDRDYDTAVVGIVSGAGGVNPAMVLDRHEDSAHVAMMGKVWCQADADAAPIRPGDLLTTSAIRGHCRKVTEPARAFGSVIGKALTPLSGGRGLIRVLVSPH